MFGETSKNIPLLQSTLIPLQCGNVLGKSVLSQKHFKFFDQVNMKERFHKRKFGERVFLNQYMYIILQLLTFCWPLLCDLNKNCIICISCVNNMVPTWSCYSLWIASGTATKLAEIFLLLTSSNVPNMRIQLPLWCYSILLLTGVANNYFFSISSHMSHMSDFISQESSISLLQ